MLYKKQLPTRFGNSRQLPLRGQLTKSDPGHFETTEEPMTTSGHLTAINDPAGTRIAREHG